MAAINVWHLLGWMVGVLLLTYLWPVLAIILPPLLSLLVGLAQFLFWLLVERFKP